MKKNKLLLSESDTRRFMRLASIEPLSESFVDTMNEQDEEEELVGPDPGPDPGPLDPLDVGPEGEEELDVEAPAVDEEFVEELVSAIADTIQDVTGVPIDVAGEEEGLEGEEGEEGLEDLEGLEDEEELAELPPEEEELEALAEHITRNLFKGSTRPEPASRDNDLVDRLSAQVAARLLNNS